MAEVGRKSKDNNMRYQKEEDDDKAEDKNNINIGFDGF